MSTSSSSPLYALSYTSLAILPVEKETLEGILEDSRERNERNNVTGVLLYRDGHFIQTLEGLKTNVEQLFESIKSDIRHRNVESLANLEIDQRVFPDWRMGFQAVGYTGAGHFSAVDSETQEEVLAQIPEDAHLGAQLIRQFVQEEYLPFGDIMRRFEQK